MNSSTLRLKPLALIMAASFPILATAAPNISANSTLVVVNGLWPWDITAPTYDNGGFTQNSVNTLFNETASSATNSYNGANIVASAYSDGNGHFGASIINRVPLGSAFYHQTAQTQLIFSDSITNNSGTTQNVNFNINIDNLKFYFNSGMISYGLTNTPINSASFTASIMVNGSAVWSSSFSANPIESGLSWNQSGTEIGLSAAATGTTCKSYYDCNLSIANYQETIGLGALATNDSLNVSYKIDLQTETNTYGGAPSINFDDPSILSGNQVAPSSASLSFAVTPVPEPEQTSMLLAGLALVGATAKRRHKSR